MPPRKQTKKSEPKKPEIGVVVAVNVPEGSTKERELLNPERDELMLAYAGETVGEAIRKALGDGFSEEEIFVVSIDARGVRVKVDYCLSETSDTPQKTSSEGVDTNNKQG